MGDYFSFSSMFRARAGMEETATDGDKGVIVFTNTGENISSATSLSSAGFEPIAGERRE